MRASPNSSPLSPRASESPSEWKSSISPGARTVVTGGYSTFFLMPRGYEPGAEALDDAPFRVQLEDRRMARDDRGHGAARLEERVDAREERAGVPRLAEDAVQRPDHRGGGRIDAEAASGRPRA